MKVGVKVDPWLASGADSSDDSSSSSSGPRSQSSDLSAVVDMCRGLQDSVQTLLESNQRLEDHVVCLRGTVEHLENGVRRLVRRRTRGRSETTPAADVVSFTLLDSD